jgi:hypothetical protein
MIARVAAVALLAVPLAGCFEATRGSIPGGESKVFEAPKYAVKGKAQYDQNWIDSQVEGGVAAFGWKRPAARPASLDARSSAKLVKAPSKRPGIVKRIKSRVWPAKGSPVLPTPVAPEWPTAAPVAPRDPVDELLQPEAKL